jgi:3',5'-cyclic AMP phosphodiesterase CpdA
MTPSRAVIAGLAALGLALSSGWMRTVLAEGGPVTVLAAGDIAFCGRGWARQVKDWFRGLEPVSGAPATAGLLDSLPGTVLIMGDLAYWSGTAAEFNDCYDKSWGRHNARSHPVPGNHEYRSPGAGPYFDYWGERAGPPGRGYYSFDLGAWHLVGLDSNLEGAEMARQLDWLVADLTASAARCVLAYWHHPLFSSGKNRDLEQMAEAYRRLYEAGASVVLAGHDHNYERFAPMDPQGKLDPGRGIRSFVVGTGGGQLKAYAISDPPRENSEVVDGSTWGLLQLALYEDRYAWRFIPVDGGTFTDSGTAGCVERSGK